MDMEDIVGEDGSLPAGRHELIEQYIERAVRATNHALSPRAIATLAVDYAVDQGFVTPTVWGSGGPDGTACGMRDDLDECSLCGCDGDDGHRCCAEHTRGVDATDPNDK